MPGELKLLPFSDISTPRPVGAKTPLKHPDLNCIRPTNPNTQLRTLSISSHHVERASWPESSHLIASVWPWMGGWMYRKLSIWQVSVQPMIKISSKLQYIHFSTCLCFKGATVSLAAIIMLGNPCLHAQTSNKGIGKGEIGRNISGTLAPVAAKLIKK